MPPGQATLEFVIVSAPVSLVISALVACTASIVAGSGRAIDSGSTSLSCAAAGGPAPEREGMDQVLESENDVSYTVKVSPHANVSQVNSCRTSAVRRDTISVPSFNARNPTRHATAVLPQALAEHLIEIPLLYWDTDMEELQRERGESDCTSRVAQ